MSGSTFGKNFRVTTFGESHGPALGVVVDGVPAGLPLDPSDIRRDLDGRRPGNSPFSSPRAEPDEAEILSGLTAGGLTNGAPIAMVVRNLNAKSSDYGEIAGVFRPGHADYGYFKKYGLPPQPGGGRSSGRETVSRVAAGAVARVLLGREGMTVRAGVAAAGKITAKKRDFDHAEHDPLRFLDPDISPAAQVLAKETMEKGDSLGGVVELWATGVPPGWGEPVFGKLDALLGGAFFSIGAVRAVEFGEGIKSSAMLGSEANDPLGPEGPETNLHGGIMGGLSTGKPIVARLYVKPTPSIETAQRSVDLSLNPVTLSVRGRHDPIIAPRLAPVAEAMALLVLADLFLERDARLPRDRGGSG
ncbi:MAG: chorismate synthase [Deltaproteobacteria bacterium]|nr:chorismate synthase [Deltaproteobacteria bacterium]